MKRNRIMILAAVLVFVLAMSATTFAAGYKFGFTAMTMNNPFFVTIEQAIRAEVEANGDTLITLDTRQDMATQIQQIEDMINQGIDLLFLCPVDSFGIQPALDMLKAAGIPVVNFDTDVADRDMVNTILVSNNVNAGYVVGQDLVERFPNGAKIAILDAPYAEACVQRVQGFMEALGGDDKYQIVAQQNGKGDIGESLPIAEAILQANPDLDVFFAINDPSALGALSAVKSAGLLNQVTIYGVDGAPDAKASIKEGGLTATGAQSPINIGLQSLEVAYRILAGEEVEKEIKVPTFLIDASNVDEYGTEGWQ
ncbi:MAG TPA: sugar ABC transporter substrate-binding protein [Firmicutes bacterium]|jgi:ribose transport system substrate-binding protein|nr:sugar ABC transporter substrate-binding protein [Bacillota bacterium]HHT43597.1 sugar ABC transporter substrate-binding protein [Bacillota bacterium]